MDKIRSIRKRYFEEGIGINKIEEETGRNRKTVRKYMDKGTGILRKRHQNSLHLR